MDIPLIGDNVTLRDAIPDDIDPYSIWMKAGEWRDLDAPWEHEGEPEEDTALESRFHRQFMTKLTLPRKRLVIALRDRHAIGWVNRYDEKRFPDSWNIGICICEDAQLNRGYGTEALHLWIEYLFTDSDIHRIAFATYSFNPRVVRVAEKLGFTDEGRDREIIQWHDRWHDRLHFSLLRSEWEVQRKRGRDL